MSPFVRLGQVDLRIFSPFKILLTIEIKGKPSFTLTLTFLEDILKLLIGQLIYQYQACPGMVLTLLKNSAHLAEVS